MALMFKARIKGTDKIIVSDKVEIWDGVVTHMWLLEKKTQVIDGRECYPVYKYEVEDAKPYCKESGAQKAFMFEDVDDYNCYFSYKAGGNTSKE